MQVRRRRRAVALAVAVPLALVTAVACWVGYQVARGADDLQAAGERLRALGGLRSADDLDERLREPAQRTADARGRFEDPLVRVAGDIPWLGRPLRTAAAIAVGADTAIRDAMIPLVAAAGDEPAKRLIAEAGVVDLAYLTDLNGPAAQSLSALDASIGTIAASPDDGWSGRVANARAEVLRELDRLRGAVDGLVVATEVGPTLLGIEGPKRYLLVPQNPAEARGTGGLVGGWVTLEADAGIIRTTGSGPSTSLEQFAAGSPVIDLGEEHTRNYGHNRPTSAWVNSNLSPHFPYAAATWAALWREQTGQQVDGVLTLDPVALSYLLRATGDVTLQDGTRVSADNVVDLTLRDAYREFGQLDDRDARKQYLQGITEAVATRALGGAVDSAVLVDSLARAVSERRLLLWTTDAAPAAALGNRSLTGRLPSGAAVGDVVVNAGANKLDYYLERSLTYSLGCSGPSSLSLELRNTAPASGLPDYVTPAQWRGDLAPGTNTSTVTLYLPPRSEVGRVMRDGQPIARPLRGSELGLPWVQITLRLAPQATTTLRVEFDQELGAARDVARIAQPLVREERYREIACDE